MAEWLLLSNGVQTGPHSDGEIRAMAAGGRLSPEDRLWKPGLEQWVAASQIKGLFPAAATAAPASRVAAPAVTRVSVAVAPRPPAPSAIATPALGQVAAPPIAAQQAVPPAAQPLSYATPPSPFNVVLKTSDKSAKGVWKCEPTAGGIVLTRKKQLPIEVPVGTPIDYPGKNSFTAQLPGRSLTITCALQQRYTKRLVGDMVAFLRGQRSHPPVQTLYALEWYFYVLIFLPLGIPILTLGGGLPIVIAGLGMGCCGMVGQREELPTWARVLIMLAINGLAYVLTIVLVVVIIASRARF